MNEPFDNALKRALHHATHHLRSLNTSPVGATRDLETMRRQLMKPLGSGTLPAEQVIDELVVDAAGGVMGCAGGRFFAWVVGGALPAALAADWLTSAWDQNAGLYLRGRRRRLPRKRAGSGSKTFCAFPKTRVLRW
jgi:hypothetical protein